MGKIGIVNRTNLKNYGSVLQVYALCEAVKKLGYSSEVVWQSGNVLKNYDLRPNKAIKTIVKLIRYPNLLLSTIKTIKEVKSEAIDECKVKKFEDFVALNFKQSFYAPNKLCKVATSDEYEKFICGSDQIWCTTTLYPDPMMYLRFAPKEKRVSYAPSLGRSYIPDYNKKILKKYIADIPYLSVREDEGQRLIQELTGREATVVADPTLLLKSSDWDKLKIDIETPSNYILCYFLDDPIESVKETISKYAHNSHNNILVLGKLKNLNYPKDRISYPIAGPGEFLTLISKAKMVITDSYHGMLFAINYHKKFWSIERAYNQFDQSSRQQTILSRLGMQKRYLRSEINITDEEIDYNVIQKKIDNFVAFSFEYLNKSLKQSYGTY